ncbi:MAG: rod shape-determining protein MreC [Desulfuromonadaceae bacterium]|nr:rod shape-determining protein MreC [Desulfuromonadaceae bacterium]
MLDFFNLQKRLFALFVLLLCALLLYSYNLRAKSSTNLFERSILLLTEPVSQGITKTTNSVITLWQDYLHLVGVKQENDKLLLKLNQLSHLAIENNELAAENARLQQLLDFRDSVNAEAVPAQVISADAMNWFRTIIINKGTDSGIQENMPVVAASGIVGRTIKCAAKSSRVLLITDASSAVAALVQRNRIRTVARGTGANLSCEYASRLEKANIGDHIVTSGNGGVFPKGILIGTITEVQTPKYGLFQTITAKPAVDFSRLEEVLVIVKSEL